MELLTYQAFNMWKVNLEPNNPIFFIKGKLDQQQMGVTEIESWKINQ